MPGMNQPSLIEEHDDALSISALYDRVEVAIARAFPKRRSMWVRGEIQSITDRTGHCYMDLVDPDGVRDRQSPVLKVKCWRTSWEPMALSLSRQGVTLEPGMVVVIRGTLDFYKPRAELGFLLNEIDVAAILGRLAQKRAALLEVLRTEGLLGRNRRLAVPAVPLRIGLVASHGTEGHNDFAGQLVGSGYAFDVVLARASVQGTKAPSSIAGALVALAARGCDLAVVVRGGGSKADLALLRLRSRRSGHRDDADPRLGRHRPYRGPVRGRHRCEQIVRHPYRMRTGARKSGVDVVGGDMSRVPSSFLDARTRYSTRLRAMTT